MKFEILAAMLTAILTLTLILTVGCATRIDKTGLTVTAGVSSAGHDCDANNVCKDTVTSKGFSEGVAHVAGQVVDAAILVAAAFIPGAGRGSSGPAVATVPPHTHAK